MTNQFGSGKGTYGDLNFVTKNSKNTVKGLQFPVSTANTGGMFARNVDSEAIKDGLLQLIMTQNGERPMNYEYGTILRAAVFEPLDGELISTIENSIQQAIRKFEPRVVIKSLRVTPENETAAVNISLNFSIKEGVFSTQTINLTVDAQGVQING